MVLPILGAIGSAIAGPVISGIGDALFGGGGSRTTPIKQARPAPAVERVAIGKAPQPVIPGAIPNLINLDGTFNFGAAFDFIQANPIKAVTDGKDADLRFAKQGVKGDPYEVAVLASTLESLANTMDQIRKTSPLALEMNKDMIDSFQANMYNAVEKNFSFENYRITEQLKSMGLENSSVALKLQTSIDRQKAEAYQKADYETQMFARELKQESLNQLGQQAALTTEYYNQNYNQNQLRLAQSELDLNRTSLINQDALNAYNAENTARLNEASMYNTNVTNRYAAEVGANIQTQQLRMQQEQATPPNAFGTILKTAGANLFSRNVNNITNGMGNFLNSNNFNATRAYNPGGQARNTVQNLGNGYNRLRDAGGNFTTYRYA